METIYGNQQGLKPSHIKQLQRLYEQRQPGDRLTTPEFAQQLVAISHEIHQPVCIYINRRGIVVRVGVGTPTQTQLSPRAENYQLLSRAVSLNSRGGKRVIWQDGAGLLLYYLFVTPR